MTNGKSGPAVAGLVLFCLLALPLAAQETSKHDWNDAEIDWKGYEDGLAEAGKTGKPLCLVFYTEWCPHCETYSGVFHHEAIVERAKSFVMIRLNRDDHSGLSVQYAPDGDYVPRTLFFDAKGVFQPSLKEIRDNYVYFYRAANPAYLAAGMDRAKDLLLPQTSEGGAE
ncbi:MAG: hypothetical protein GY716_25750 [bacterium]|nr:hypothetical protein [bacterium]